MKKLLFLGVFLMFFGSAIALAQETQESNLTPRQLLLLQVPKDFSITLGGITWEVTHESGEPLEAIAVVNIPEMIIFLTLGSELRAYAHFLFMPPDILMPSLFGKVGENEALDKAEAKAVTEILEAFEILTDAQLAEFIKKNFSGKKAAFTL